ncbi:MAG: hypothetical protein R3F61_20530 [Myxococcota bacterium]
MSWMSVLKWGRPVVTEGPPIPGQLRRRDKIGWQEVLRTVADVEMDIRRLHASRLYDRGVASDGTIRMTFAIGPGSTCTLRSVTSDPALDPVKDEIAHIVVGASWPNSGIPVLVDLDCSFESVTETGFADDDFGGPSRGRGGFGDPF